MATFKRAFFGLSLSLILGVALLTVVYVVPVLTTEIDPDLGKPQCPGGKDWDLPGSSCHDGIISDYAAPVASADPAKASRAVKRKRGR